MQQIRGGFLMSATTPEELRNEQATKYYLILLHPIPDRPLTAEAVDRHAAHLAELDDSGKLVMAGPIVERQGGLIVLQVESAAEAMAIAEEDPMVRGAYETYELGTWLMSNRQNGYRPNIQPGSPK
jgi:uncharacterized protein